MPKINKNLIIGIALVVWCLSCTYTYVCEVNENYCSVFRSFPELPESVANVQVSDGSKHIATIANNFKFLPSQATVLNYDDTDLDIFLKQIVSYLQVHSHKKLYISGGAAINEEQGTQVFAHLGQARAEGIRQYLLSSNVVPEQIVAVANDSLPPVAYRGKMIGGIAFDFKVMPEYKQTNEISANILLYHPLVLYFEQASARIKFSSEERLYFEAIKSYLLEHSTARVEVQGFSDITGKEGIQKYIADQRSKTVSNYLQSIGIDSSKIVSKAVEKQFLTQEEHKQHINRRVLVNVAHYK